MMESICVRVWSVIHKTDDFHIFSAEPAGDASLTHGRKITCKGRLFGIQGVSSGVPLKLHGNWVSHPKFGRQFDLTGWSPWSDTSVGVESFLRHCLGVLSEDQIDLIVDSFGTDTFRILTDEPAKLQTLEGFDDDRIQLLLEAWSEASCSSDLSTFFADHSVTSEQMKALFSTFGPDAKRILEQDPYRLLDVPGFHFSKADEVAQGVGLSLDDPRRYEGAVLWALREGSLSGHLCVRRSDLSPNLRELIRTSAVESFDELSFTSELTSAVQRLKDKGRVFVDPDVGVYLPSLFKFERDSANYLARFLTPVKLDIELQEFLDTYETVHQIKLSEAQKGAVEKLLSSRVLVLTGLPGTGKTTVIRTFVELFQKAGVGFTLMAPTGIASKRLSSVTNHPAGTIHRTLRYTGVEWGYNAECKYSVEAIIVDEMSMVDQELFYRILDALDEGTILVLVGDDAQLPSVGPGNVLRELVNCQAIPTVRLTQIFRQAQESDIVLNSHRINKGECIEAGDKDSDFRFVPLGDESKMADLIVQMSVKLKERDANFQILSPKYDGVVGVTNLNDLLREALNPESVGKKEATFGALKFREGDRIMVIKNDYQLGVYNGDMGKLMSIRSEYFTVRIHGIGDGGVDVLKEIPRKDIVAKIRLAYAITVHKSQGSEFDTVILPMVRTHGRMLQRNLFYTAVTRAKKRVWVLGDRQSIQRAIDNDKVVLRNTGFEKAIQSALECPTQDSKPSP